MAGSEEGAEMLRSFQSDATHLEELNRMWEKASLELEAATEKFETQSED